MRSVSSGSAGREASTSTTLPPPKANALAYSYLFRLAHWLVLLSAPVMLLTGLANYATARPEWTLLAGDYPKWLPSGKLQFYHLLAGVVFASGLILSLVAYLSAGKSRGSWGLRRIIQVVLLTAGALSLASALPLLFIPAVGLYTGGRALHALSGLIVIPVALLIHFILGLTSHRRLLIPAFHPWKEARWQAVAGLIVTGVIVLLCTPNFIPTVLGTHELKAPRVQSAGDDMAALPWTDAPRLAFVLANGAGFDGGQTTVQLQALHDGERIYVRAEWLDPKEDRQYMPWRKTGKGWERLVTNAKDENVYYEDKFSLIFPDPNDRVFRRAGCTGYCHLGGGRAYGYKGASKSVDVWHWKATRSDSLDRVDDKYWLGFDLSQEDVGRHGDPKEAGGYQTNENEEKTAPRWLPRAIQEIRKGVILADNAQPYSEEAARAVPEGTIVPGIYASLWKGDRGDVECASRHADGKWVVFMKRKLNTGSPQDTAFAPGGCYPFACAAFDRTSKRHAYNHEVYYLRLAK